MNAKGFSYFLSADAELHELEAVLKRKGLLELGVRVEEIRALLAKALSLEQDEIYRELELLT